MQIKVKEMGSMGRRGDSSLDERKLKSKLQDVTEERIMVEPL